jgi:hypothetical protein
MIILTFSPPWHFVQFRGWLFNHWRIRHDEYGDWYPPRARLDLGLYELRKAPHAVTVLGFTASIFLIRQPKEPQF